MPVIKYTVYEKASGNRIMNYPKIKKVKAHEDFTLEITFDNDVIKVFDCKVLFENLTFEPLKNYNFFKMAENNICPYAVVWNDELDIAESELWIKGKIAS